MTSIFDGYTVYLYNENDKVITDRDFSLKANQKVKPRLLWDHLDLVYFLGYALWNYLCSHLFSITISLNVFRVMTGLKATAAVLLRYM